MQNIYTVIICLICAFSSFCQYNPNTVGISIKLETIEITEFQFAEKMTFAEAQLVCKQLGPGWRLPNVEELNELSRYFNSIQKFKGPHWILGNYFNELTNQIEPIAMEMQYDFYDPDGPFTYPVDYPDWTYFVWPVRSLKH